MLSGELDEHSAKKVRQSLDMLFDRGNFEKVIMDLSELDFMDSTGIGVLLGRYKRLKPRAIPIFITNPSRHAEQIFNISGLFNIMPKIN